MCHVSPSATDSTTFLEHCRLLAVGAHHQLNTPRARGLNRRRIFSFEMLHFDAILEHILEQL